VVNVSPLELSGRVRETCHDHLPSVFPRRSSAAAIWSGERQMLRKRAQVAEVDALRGAKDGR
jgi:hypothetical protein